MQWIDQFMAAYEALIIHALDTYFVSSSIAQDIAIFRGSKQMHQPFLIVKTPILVTQLN